MAEDVGPVEAAYREWVDSLGDALSLRQKASKAQILALARMLDAAPGEALSPKVAASRELRAAALELRDASRVGSQSDEEEVVKPTGPPPDGVADIGEAARRRRAAGR